MSSGRSAEADGVVAGAVRVGAGVVGAGAAGVPGGDARFGQAVTAPPPGVDRLGQALAVAAGPPAGALADAGVAASSPPALPATSVRPRLTSSARRSTRGSIQRASRAAVRPAVPGSAASDPSTTPTHSHSRQAQAAAPTTVTSACSGASVNQRGVSETLDGRSASPGPARSSTAAIAPATANPRRGRSVRWSDLIPPSFVPRAAAQPAPAAAGWHPVAEARADEPRPDRPRPDPPESIRLL